MKSISLVERLNKSKSSVWDLGNSVLYKLCKDNPHHKSDDEIGAKVWLIGRAYSASIERRKENKNINDDFYTAVVIPQIKQSNIDKWIDDCMTINTKDIYLQTHKKITDLFKKISGLEKRSLASKYLHFHLPEIFFIYDSRAVNAINILYKEFAFKKENRYVELDIVDSSYASFYEKCISVQNEIFKEYNVRLTCRELDNLLIGIANDNLRI